MEHDERIRRQVAQLLESGLQTEVEPRAYSSEAINDLIARLQSHPAKNVEEKLKIAGFTMQPYQPPDTEDDLVQSCETCMYFVVHRRYCELPELAIPVEKDWSCRLWRI